MKEILDIVFDKDTCRDYKFVVAGAFNINTLENDKKKYASMCMFNLYNMKASMNEPSRATEETSICIDNIFCNFRVEHCQTIHLHMSAHHTLVIEFPCESVNLSTPNSIQNILLQRD
ncbi:hypothetical protein WA026_015326 [Henosepilachna vigintioctopunctata]|uniref:Uncharacterized protein n=1 Tax=Henosepilachna vigintioctopunctata TaxID=420089 RepID=A0AAW1UE10_9CUCU